MRAGEAFRLGEFLVHPSLNRVSRGGETVSIQPRFMDLLVYLAQHPGKVVSKEEILAAVWAREFVSEGTLTHAVAVIRQALGDNVRSPQYIETIPTRGYRLVAAVSAEGDGAGAPAALAERPAAKSRSFLLPVLGSLAVVVVALAIWRVVPATKARPMAGRAGRIVVLPFQNLGDPARDFIASGITDDITTRLAGAHGVGVVSRTSALYCAKAGKSVRQIGEELGADYVLEGTVRQDAGKPNDGRVRVNAQLIRASDDTSLWVGSFGSEVVDVVQVGAAIAGRVIRELGVSVGKPEQNRLESRPTGNANAYQAYLCGIRYRALESREQLGLAVAMFERAVSLDPTFALAWAELAVANARIHHLRFDDSPERLAKAKQAADRAFFLRPELPETHMALGALYHLGRREYPRALEEYNIAAQDLPNDSGLFALIADVYRRQGKWAEARAEIERVVNLDPQNYTALLALGETLYPMRAYEGADRAFQRAAEINPDRNAPYLRKFWNLLAWDGSTERAEPVLLDVPLSTDPEVVFGRSYLRYLRRDFRGALDVIASVPEDASFGPYAFASRPLAECVFFDALADRPGVERACGAAIDVLRTVSHQRPDDVRALLELGQAHALLGHRMEAVRFADKAIGLVPVGKDACDGPGYLLLEARVLARAGETRRAVDIITRLLAVPSPLSVPLLRLDPGWDALRNDRGFEALLDLTPVPPA